MARKAKKKKSYLKAGTRITKRTKGAKDSYTVTGYTPKGNPIKKLIKGLF